jgi:hypothetical protein
MLFIPVDPGYAFDYLSILEIKRTQGFSDITTIEECITILKAQLGVGKYYLVKDSPEYVDVRAANIKTFIAVDSAKINKCSAKDVQDANHERYLAKKRLQERFFPDSPLVEKKN